MTSMDSERRPSKLEQKATVLIGVGLAVMALAWVGFYVSCRLGSSLDSNPGGRVFFVPLSTPEWVYKGMQGMARVESLMTGETIQIWRPEPWFQN